MAPLIADVAGAGKISVGAPWFVIAFSVPMIPLIYLIGLGMHMAWRTQNAAPIVKLMRVPLIFALVLGVVVPLLFYGRVGLLLVVGTIGAFWIMASSVIQPLRSWRRERGATRITRSALGMCVAHFGVGVFTLGVTIVSAFSIETDNLLRPGGTLSAGHYEFAMRELSDVQGPNYIAKEGVVDVRHDGEFVAQLRPQKRQYKNENWMTEAGIEAGWNRDLIISLGEEVGSDVWSVRVQYRPLVRFIWLGALIMAFGGLLAVSDRRYRTIADAEVSS
jgi:cytochrome c-type biogenesis protein CcmF